MKANILSVLILCFSLAYGQVSPKLKIKKGNWIAQLQLSENDALPFEVKVEKVNRSFRFSIENGEESIVMQDPILEGDSIRVHFPFFNSELIFRMDGKKSFNGYWINYNKGNNYRIPLSANRKRKAPRFFTKKDETPANVNGRWEVTFEPGTNGSYPAVGIFNQEEESNEVNGTFLTETGDYRFLAGVVTDDSLYLSCFDGSHAFLFKALLNDTLSGKFFSGKHWQSEWTAERNETFELKSPDELTYIVDDQPVEFSLKDLKGNDYNFPNDQLKGKVVIIQIMGTWCPNCLDETIFYTELYETYHEDGLEIISIGYENGDEFTDYVANIQRLKEKLDLDFTFLVGGRANKVLASEQFSMLNEIISFPTSIYVDRHGMVKRIHTGFNGPGTGVYYQEYVESTYSLIESLLAD